MIFFFSNPPMDAAMDAAAAAMDQVGAAGATEEDDRDEKEEKPRWRCKLTITLGGAPQHTGCKCVLPLEWKDIVANRCEEGPVSAVGWRELADGCFERRQVSP